MFIDFAWITDENKYDEVYILRYLGSRSTVAFEKLIHSAFQ
jgi:hypothetical protein